VSRRSLTGVTVLAVFAHPDDESLACGGTLARAADEGARVALLCLSRGEHGTVTDSGDPSALARLRTTELHEAARVLGVSEVLILDHPDGSLRWAELAFDIDAVIQRIQPDAVITFGEDGLYWHPDHIGVHEQTLAAVRALGEAGPSLYFVTLPPGGMEGLVSASSRRRGAEAGLWGLSPAAFGAEAQPAAFAVDVRGWAQRKLDAIRCHRTQIAPGHALAHVDVSDVRQWLGFEHFRRSSDGGACGVLERIGNPATSPEAAGSHAP